MKSLYKNYAFKLAAAVLTASVALSACSKESLVEENFRGDGTKLSVKVLGISEEGGISPNLKMSTSKQGAGKEETGLGEIKSFNAFDAAVSLERDIPNQTKVSIGSSADAGAGNNLMAEAMEQGVNYRLLLYKSDGTFVSSTILESGTAGEIPVAVGEQYNWYAVSYNSKTETPVINPADPKLAVPENTDLLYHTGTVSVPQDSLGKNVPLNIVFTHKLSRIAVEVNTQGMFGDISTASIAVSGATVQKGTLDLMSGALTDLEAYTPSFDYSDFVNVDENYADRKAVYLYTADNTPVTGIDVEISGLVVDRGAGETLDFNTVLSADPAEFTFNVTPVLGSNQRAVVNLLESAIEIAGVRWARSNVIDLGSGANNRYRFQARNIHSNNPNSFFSFQGEQASRYGRNGDPCTLVYPQGVWRQASELDFRKLVGGFQQGNILRPNYPAQAYNKGIETGRGYIEYPVAAQPGSPYTDQNLRFNFNGFGIGVGAVIGLVTIDLGSTYGASGHYWTTTDASILGPVLQLGGWYYTSTESTGPFLLPDLDIALLNIDVLETAFRNVRCVRVPGR